MYCYFSMWPMHSFFSADFQTTALQLLVKIQAEVKELKRQLDHNTIILQAMQQSTIDDGDFELPDGLELPMSTDDHMQILEDELENGLFRKRLVSVLLFACNFSFTQLFLFILFTF